MTLPRHLTALQPVSRLRQAEAAAIAEESALEAQDWPESRFQDPAAGWTPKDWAQWNAWCDAEDALAQERDATIAESERLAEIERYRLARLGRTNPHDL